MPHQAVEVYVELTGFATTANRRELAGNVTALEDAGAAGVSVSDHLFGTRSVTVNGTYISAKDLPLSPRPLSPRPQTRPRILVGGSSDRILRMAGRYADNLDLHGDPQHGKVAGATMA